MHVDFHYDGLIIGDLVCRDWSLPGHVAQIPTGCGI